MIIYSRAAPARKDLTLAGAEPTSTRVDLIVDPFGPSLAPGGGADHYLLDSQKSA